MDKKESIKRKVKGLLEKTTENGATESEAISALQKAKELMMEHFISEHELNDPYANEKCTSVSTSHFKTGYDVTNIYPALCLLFDCEHFWDSKKLTFFGYEEDVQLCIYFYNFILKACFAEKDKYVQSLEYQKLKQRYHGRTLVSSFIKGFIIALCIKMHDIYDERKGSVSECIGLAIIEKNKKVKQQYDELNFKTRIIGAKQIEAEAEAFKIGYNKGKDTALTQGINEKKREGALALSI